MAERPRDARAFTAWNEEMVRRFDPDAYHTRSSLPIRAIERLRVRAIRRLLDARADSRVLEVGVGGGNVLERIGGRRFGIDPETLLKLLNVSTGMNNSTQKKFRQFVLNRGFDSGFSLELMVKDLSIATGMGKDGAVPAPFASLCREMWAAASAMLGPGQDHTAMAQLSERLAGPTLAER